MSQYNPHNFYNVILPQKCLWSNLQLSDVIDFLQPNTPSMKKHRKINKNIENMSSKIRI